MIETASKYGVVPPSGGAKSGGIQARGRAPERGGGPLFVPTITGTRRRLALRDWYWREIREGGFLFEYLQREKARTPEQLRRVAQMMAGFTQNPESDFRRLATMPARLYHRWKAEDQHFFEDDENLRSLKRDNPDVCAWVGAKRVKGERKKYGPN